jgi:uncharacterized membrane protein YbhN (UPF0104 family)
LENRRILDIAKLTMTESTRDTVIRLLFAALILGAFAVAGTKILSAPGFLRVFADLRHTNPAWIAAIAGVYLLSSFANSELTRIVVNRLNYHVTRGQAFAVFMVRVYGNLLLAKAGIGMSAAFMSVRYGVRMADFGSMLVGVTILQFLCIGLMGLACQFLLLVLYDDPPDFLIAVTFAGCVAGSGACLLVPAVRLPRMPQKIAAFLKQIDAGIGRKGTGFPWKTGVIPLLMLQTVVVALRAVRLWLAFAAVGTPVNPIGLCASSLLGDIGLLVGITPMGIGFREAAIGYSARLVGASAPTAVAVTLVDRAIWSVTILIVTQVILLGCFTGRPKLKHQQSGRKPGIQEWKSPPPGPPEAGLKIGDGAPRP